MSDRQGLWRGLPPLALILLLSACASTGDLEATQRRVDQINQQTVTRLNDLDSRISSEKLIDLFNQVEKLQAEVGSLRGELEVLKHNQDAMQQRQTDIYNDLDGRLSQLGTGGKPAAQASTAAPVQSGDDYGKAMTLLDQKKFENAIDALENFINANPSDPRAVDAQYWLGIAHTGLKEYNSAIDIHQRFAADYPKHAKAPDALRNMAQCQLALNQRDAAKATLQRLVKLYPNSDAAKRAKELLTKL